MVLLLSLDAEVSLCLGSSLGYGLVDGLLNGHTEHLDLVHVELFEREVQHIATELLGVSLL